MEQIVTPDYARRLYEAHGQKAIAEAAQKAVDFEKKGDKEAAQSWRRVEAAVKEMVGPHQP
ncbi:MAG TPA: hypothetical protein VK446_02240 [Methylocystis sp.]|nr:hypothetical protein [Methylocystis sp.]